MIVQLCENLTPLSAINGRPVSAFGVTQNGMLSVLKSMVLIPILIFYSIVHRIVQIIKYKCLFSIA